MWSMFGKVPAEGDFVRSRAGDPLVMACFRWVSDAVAQRPEWPRTLPSTGARFLFVHASLPERFAVGAMVRSEDRVGRAFPLVALETFDTRSVGASEWVAIPLAWHGRLGDLVEVLNELREGTASCADFERLVGTGEAPSSLNLAKIRRTALGQLESLTAAEFHARIFQGDSPHYAYHTVRVASAIAEGGPALVCPTVLLSDSCAWLDLISGLRRRAEPPGLVWTTGPGSKLVVCLGEMPIAALEIAAGLASGSPRVWPLNTTHEGALQVARASIAPLLPLDGADMRTVFAALGSRS
jgi:type VI secretion system protein ImpM